jgi:hypothetical protein
MISATTEWLQRLRRRRQLRYLFVVTYGRSGSTLVQGLLNTIPRTLVRGENNFYVLPLYQAMTRARAVKRKYTGPRSRRTTSAFYGLQELRLEGFAEHARRLVEEQLLGDAKRSHFDIVGFKEIRWNQISPEAQTDFFAFLDRAFPGVQYVLNRRNHDDVRTSDFWRGRGSDVFVDTVTRIEEIQEFLRATRPDRVYDVEYEVLTGMDDSAAEKQLRGLAEFVTGTCDDALLAEMRATLTVGHGPKPFGASRRDESKRGGDGRVPPGGSPSAPTG